MTKRWFSLILFAFFSLNACSGDPNLPRVEPDLVARLKTRPSLKRFTEALETTGVAATLQAEGNYTIFAPMDVAVAAGGPLDQATVRHHILTERVNFSDLAGENTSYTTLHTDEIEVDATEVIRIGEGLMVESDISASNGVIHVIDKVLTPGDVPTNLVPAAPAGSLSPATELTDPAAQPTTPGEAAIVPAAPAATQ